MTGLVSFMLAGRLCAIDAGMVREVAYMPAGFTTVPGAPDAVMGVYNLRGKIVPVLCLRACLGLAVGPRYAPGFCLVVEYKGELYSLAVDEAGRVLSLGDNTSATQAPWHKAVSSCVCLEDGPLSVLDMENLLGHLSRPEQ